MRGLGHSATQKTKKEGHDFSICALKGGNLRKSTPIILEELKWKAKPASGWKGEKVKGTSRTR